MPFPVVDGLRSLEIGTPGEMRARLNALILAGTKRATAGLMTEYEAEDEPIERVGELLALVDDELRRIATVRVTRVEVSRFADAPDGLALAEGEGDLSGDDFRASHLAFWTRQGETITDDTTIVQVYFELVESPSRPVVLFVCVRNAGRSQMAAGFLEHLAGDRVDVRSAGSLPGEAVHPIAVAAMAEVGIDIAGRTPRALDATDVGAADVVVTMGCGDACPVFPRKRYLDWDLEDPADRPLEDVRVIRDDIRRRVEALLAELG